ncbi:tyrosine-type recombinase/integrase [Noviherbaspirillum pedocola]|uniref:Tyrosine-type recombinase/integrase n=1 Tax=Noviherbaspirillum pedocola TaxID=2801341 RepID=A0A934SY16_9BURK|nr:tyrosine-type recombinase/integrase [Noviherbaspirillum pedocola]MBK4738645.1 tyrosine-type recombinase/integrase [Noviherbaspirillum pedocola]
MPYSWTDRGTVLIQLGRHHFAFYRGYLDGISLRALADRYLETTEDLGGEGELDLRVAKSMLKWIRGQLMVAAKRTGSNARLIRLPPEALRVTYGAHVPTLEAFREERDPYETFTEQELIDLFQEEYGNAAPGLDRRTERNNRLRNKQLAILRKIEDLTNADPSLSDAVGGWLDPAIAKRLQAAGLYTLEQLVGAVNNHGFRWYTKVPRIGVKAAKQIVDWLLLPETEAALGVKVSGRGIKPRKEWAVALTAPRAMTTDIVPLESFHVPHELNGAFGTNRGERSSLNARNDYEAIQVWLARYKAGSHTVRTYRKEAERFLLWSVLEAGKALSSLKVEDCIRYRDFLWYLGRQTPEVWAQYNRIPQQRWIGQRGIERFSPLWRPFEGPLSESSQKHSLVVLQSMMQWLTEQKYLHNNPFKAMPHLARRGTEGLDISRSLTVAEWRLVKAYLLKMPQDARYYRLRFILALAYSTGCRLSELVALRSGNLRSFTRAGESDLSWEIGVTGKGNKKRWVQLNPQVVNEIRSYFHYRGHESWRNIPNETPLIAAHPVPGRPGTPDDPLTSSRLYQVLKAFFAEVARSVSQEDFDTARKLNSASTHWLRHTFATHGIHNGMTLETIRELLGHTSLTTTSVYVTSEKDKRSREVEKLGDLATF